MNTKAKWTFAVYMAGDNTLSDAGERDLEEMRRVGSSQDVNVVVEFDRSGPNHDTQRYHIQKDGKNEQIESLGETDCGDPNVLLKFIRWVGKKYPAKHYALILWNHGGGWEPSEIDLVAQEVKAIDYGRSEGSMRSRSPLGRTLFRPTLKTVMKQPTVTLRQICCDDGTGHSVDTIELGKVLSKAAAALHQPIDLLGMDACLMSNLEVMYQAQKYVKYIASSEDSEPNEGWPYDAVLSLLVNNPDMSAADLACEIVQNYIAFYQNRQSNWPVTQTALDLSKINDLVVPLDNLSEALIKGMPSEKQIINETQCDCYPFVHFTLFDIAEFCTGLQANSVVSEVQQATQQVCSALQPGTNHLVMSQSHWGNELKQCAGLSVYLPERRIGSRVSPSYEVLDFAIEHRWLNMLQEFHKK